MNFKTYYDVLRVQRNATKETIEAAYKSLMVRAEENRIKGIHNPDDEEPETLFRAYDILSDDQKRRDYDRDIQANVNTYNQPETGIQQQVNYRNSNVSPIRPVNRPPRKSSILNKKNQSILCTFEDCLFININNIEHIIGTSLENSTSSA